MEFSPSVQCQRSLKFFQVGVHAQSLWIGFRGPKILKILCTYVTVYLRWDLQLHQMLKEVQDWEMVESLMYSGNEGLHLSKLSSHTRGKTRMSWLPALFPGKAVVLALPLH